MRRLAAFVVLLLVFAVWRFPHHRVVERLLTRRLEGVPVRVDVGSVTPTLWPLGYRLGDVVVQAPEIRAALDAVTIGLWPGSGVRAAACGGTLDGDIERVDGGRVLRLEFAGVDPSKCLSAGPLEVSGSFDGSLMLEGLGGGPRASVVGNAARAGELRVEGTAGRVTGHLPARPSSQRAGRHDADAVAVPDAEAELGTPIGTWDFTRASVRARLDRGAVRVQDAWAEAEGVRWETDGASLTPGTGGRTRIDAELRARRLDDSPRAKAVLGLLPRAEERDGWRRYRISGTLDAPSVVGLR